jgi:hypothetical protein
MAVPNTFATRTGSIPLNELDANFATTITIGTTAVALGDSAATISGLTLQTPILVTPALGTPASGNLSSCTGVSLTTGVVGVLPIANGGTGATTNAGTPYALKGANADITSITGLTTALATSQGGTGSTSTTYASLTTNVSGTLPIANGGTGSTSTTYASLTTNVSGILPIANGGTGSTSTTYASLTTNVSGTLPIANGGTNSTATATAGGIGYGTGTAHAYTTVGTSGQALISNGAAAPSWSTVSGPAFSAYQSTAQSVTVAALKILFQTEEYDTNSNYDATTSRFTPTVAGYYQVNAGLQVMALTIPLIHMYKNGVPNKVGGYTGVAGNSPAPSLSCVVYCNGTTDYLEIWGSSSVVANSNTTNTYFQAVMIRGA